MSTHRNDQGGPQVEVENGVGRSQSILGSKRNRWHQGRRQYSLDSTFHKSTAPPQLHEGSNFSSFLIFEFAAYALISQTLKRPIHTPVHGKSCEVCGRFMQRHGEDSAPKDEQKYSVRWLSEFSNLKGARARCTAPNLCVRSNTSSNPINPCTPYPCGR